MTRERVLVIRIASHLLQYPDGDLFESLSSMSDWISELPPGRSREVLDNFLMNMQNRKLLSLQEEYSRIFDLNPATSLNLTYHKYGDKRVRGAALARLNQVYRRAGYETAGRELPDFLPLVLEFLSVCPGEEYAWIVQEYRSQMETLSARVKESRSFYAELLWVVLCSI
jgi:nitrate reductase delta subunit